MFSTSSSNRSSHSGSSSMACDVCNAFCDRSAAQPSRQHDRQHVQPHRLTPVCPAGWYHAKLGVCGCLCVCVCVCVCVCACVCVCVCMYALRIVSRDKILHFKNLVLLLSTHMLHLFLCRSLLYSTLLSGRLTSLLPRVILNEWPWPFYSAFLNVHCSRVKILVYCLFYLLLCTVRQICL